MGFFMQLLQQQQKRFWDVFLCAINHPLMSLNSVSPITSKLLFLLQQRYFGHYQVYSFNPMMHCNKYNRCALKESSLLWKCMALEIGCACACGLFKTGYTSLWGYNESVRVCSLSYIILNGSLEQNWFWACKHAHALAHLHQLTWPALALSHTKVS